MTGEPEPVPPLDEALETFLATRSSYLTAAEQAQVNLLRALVRAAQASPAAGAASALPAEVVAELRALRAEVAALRQAQNILDPGEELERLRSEVAALRQSQQVLSDALRSGAGSSVRRGRLPGPPPAPSAYPTEPRSLEYWAENMPDFGDEPSPADLKSIVERPRVRPEDIVVTEQELERQRELTRRKPHTSSPRARLITIVVLVIVLGLIIAVLWVNGIDLPTPRPRR